MKLVVGLGNPGDKYTGTRHNIGFQVAEQVAQRQRITLKKKGYQGCYGVGRIAISEATILLPQTYMNCSGASVNAAYRSLGIDPGDLIVICDDLDLPFGRLRIKGEGGHGGHNGLRDIIAVLGCKEFIRLRIGIGRPERGDITSHVLSGFAPKEKQLLPELIATAADAVERILSSGVTEAMNTFNNYNLLDEH
ncbi:peptidyl-tRNA hydrolase [Desulfuromusa kysingii]|uniref:Peptidyl-tRNA hydrolase n=1 Tax=Desulfuromusa kysingii TaxID=37625 RepID=A0A1H3ZF32_9BACT|nr:aminoacyl-tRNA hydrolase [Desulfuromusa kysingii]SEA22118.1 peptidyl-tRNA hydrolase [Desulfuromusa kysingii]